MVTYPQICAYSSQSDHSQLNLSLSSFPMLTCHNISESIRNGYDTSHVRDIVSVPYSFWYVKV